jgi:hypothetical protein
MAEIDLRIESLNAAPKSEDDPADAPAALPTGPAVSRPGDLWTLGRHRVLCGNALDEAAYARLMNGKRAAMMFTDPPYNVPIAGHVSGLGAVQHREFAMASGEMSSPEFTAFLHDVFDFAARHCRDGALHLVCMDWRHMPELLAAGSRAYTELKNLCVWAKDNAGMGSLYRSQHELVFVYKSGRAAPPQQYRARPARAAPEQSLVLPGGELLRASGRGGQPARAAPDGEAGRPRSGLHPRLLGTR